jgi:hypothetical protein
MANVNHSTLTDPYLHEPKGVASAPSGSVYVADGAGSGDWTKGHAHINGYIAFDSATPAYQHSVTTSFTVIDPTFAVTNADGFSGTASPNARLIYTDAGSLTAFCTFTFNFKNNSGTDRDLEMIFYKNGSPMNGGHIIVTAASGEWKSATLADTTTLAQNDYIEIFVKADASFTLDVAGASLIVHGVPA